MDEMLLIRPVSQEDCWEWGVVNKVNGACIESGTDTLEKIRPESSSRETVLLLPGQDVRLEWVEAPPGRGTELRTAVAYLLEEQLCERVEALHFSLGPRAPSGRVATAVIHRDLLQTWLARLSAQGIAVIAAVPEVLAIPRDGDGIAMADMGDRFLVRLDDCVGYAVEPLLAADLVAGLPAEISDAPLILCLPGMEPLPAPIGRELQQKGFREVREERYNEPMALFAKGLAGRRWPLNLLQGELAPHTKRGLGQRLRPAFVIALLALMVHVGWSFYDLHELDTQRAALQSESVSVFRKAFPTVRRIVDLQTQAQQQLKTLESRQNDGSAFLRTFGVIGELLHKQSGLKLTGFNFDDGKFDLRLEAGAIDALDKMTSQLKSQRLSAKIISTEKHGDRIVGRLSITREGT